LAPGLTQKSDLRSSCTGDGEYFIRAAAAHEVQR